MVKRGLITGSSGLIGSQMVRFLDERGWEVHGIDTNMREALFGKGGDTRPVLDHLRSSTKQFTHYSIDVRDRDKILDLVGRLRPDFILHAAAQPSHDLAREIPFDDFDINAVGTLNLLEAARRFCLESPFVFLSTNKVYGDAPNNYRLMEHDTRLDYADHAMREGIDESCAIDESMHTLMGASKTAADILTQEYGRTYGMPTACFRCSCLTGPMHVGVEQHGFLAYMARVAREGRTYRVFGYEGKQVRDNLHAGDVCSAALEFFQSPDSGAVYNLGGGRANSVSVREALAKFSEITGKQIDAEYGHEPRAGDHLCYITNTARFRRRYPGWAVTYSLDDILLELVHARAGIYA